MVHYWKVLPTHTLIYRSLPHKMLYTKHGFLYPPPTGTTVLESLPPLITIIILPESLRPLSPSPQSRAPRAARAARALMALSKLSADDEHGIILGQRAAPRRVLQLFRLFRS